MTATMELEPQSLPNLMNLATRIERNGIRSAYEDVRSDNTDNNWAVFKFEGNEILCTALGVEFEEFCSHFRDDDRAFGFIRLQTGDEMSKRTKFLFVTWVGPAVSTMKRAKMSTDKALVKEIISNFAMELQLESADELNLDYFREEIAKVGGVNYGTGVRDL